MLNKDALLQSNEQFGKSEPLAQMPLILLSELGSVSGNLEFIIEGKKYQVGCANSTEQLLLAKQVDDLAFGMHLGITLEELQGISENGAVLLLLNDQNELVGELQVLLEPIPQYPKLGKEEAYCYGVAIHPQYQNHGLAQALYVAQEMVAIEAGKTKISLTVRLENAQSVRAHLKSGYQITGYDKEHYGPLEEGGARLIMEKDLTLDSFHFNPQSLSQHIANGEVVHIHQDAVGELTEQPAHVSVLVTVGDDIDMSAHALVDEIIGQGYRGIGILKPTEYGAVNPTKSLMVFKKEEK